MPATPSGGHRPINRFESLPMTPAKMPDNACDCHIHIYDSHAALAPSATFKPPPASLVEYRQVQHELGLQRVVLVQPTGYGFDNHVMLDALAQLGSAARAIASVPADTSDDELARLHGLGVRGIRFMMIPGAGGLLPWDSLAQVAERIAALGWIIDLQLDGRELPERQDLIDSLPGKLVIDHTGKFLEPVPVQHAAFRALLAVLDKPDRWVKLSAPYETSRIGPPHYDDVAVLAKALVSAHPDRCLWASNWPHPNRSPAPSNAAMLDILSEWAPDQAVRQQILVDNPARAFDF